MEKVKNISKSKRLWMTLLSVVIWGVLISFKDLNPIEVATALTIILAPYLAAETMKKSQ